MSSQATRSSGITPPNTPQTIAMPSSNNGNHCRSVLHAVNTFPKRAVNLGDSSRSDPNMYLTKCKIRSQTAGTPRMTSPAVCGWTMRATETLTWLEKEHEGYRRHRCMCEMAHAVPLDLLAKTRNSQIPSGCACFFFSPQIRKEFTNPNAKKNCDFTTAGHQSYRHFSKIALPKN